LTCCCVKQAYSANKRKNDPKALLPHVSAINRCASLIVRRSGLILYNIKGNKNP